MNIFISSNQAEIPDSSDKEIDEKKKKLLLNIVPSEELREISEFEILATTMIRKIGMTPSYKLKHAMFKKMLLKILTSFYDDRLKEISNKTEFGIFIFTCLMKKYMMRKAAQNRFKHLLSSCVKYKSISRVRLFGRFIGLYDAFDIDDLNLYLTTSNTLQASLTGKIFSNHDSSEKHFTLYSRCVECVKLLNKSLPAKEIMELNQKLDSLKIIVPNVKLGIVDVDEFLELLIERYHFHKNESYNFIKEIYEAGDVIII